jgi:hypothetical protein
VNDANYAVEKARVERLYDTWAVALGVRDDWTLNITYYRFALDARPVGDRKRPPECENSRYGRVMQIICQWEYMTADLEVNCLLTARLSDRQLTEYFLHELGHMFLSGLATLHAGPSGKIGHAWYMLEEHTATRLAFAMLWLADRVARDRLDGVYPDAEHETPAPTEAAEPREAEAPGEGDLCEREREPEGHRPGEESDVGQEGEITPA